MTDKITIFKEVFDYYYDGEITKEQLADLLLMHYETRWGDGVDAKEIEDKDLRMIWRTLQHSVIKSTKNAKQYEKQQNKKSAFQEVTTTEFDIPNCQIPNTAHLSPSNSEEVQQPQPIGDNATESLKTGKDDIKINLTEKEINEVMGTYKGTIEELNKRTTINDFSSIDRLVPKLNRDMALKQVKPFLSKEKNIGRLNDALSTFLKDVSLDDRIKYYEFLLEQSFAVA